MSAITDRIRSRAHWDVVVRPAAFRGDRIPYDELDEILQRATVRFRGWPVPFIDSRDPVLRGDDWIGQDIDAEMVSHYEAWRFFTSGQFNHLRAVSADWREGREATHAPPGYSSAIEVWEVTYYITEVYELAARLALSAAGDDPMQIDVTLTGLENRALVVGQSNRAPFIQPYTTTAPSITRSVTAPRESLVADPRRAAASMSRDFFLRFGWKPSIEQLIEHQSELTESR